MCRKKRFLLFILTLVVMALPLRAEGIAFFSWNLARDFS